MPEWIYSLSDLNTILVLVGCTTAISVITILICKRYILHRLRYRDNQTIASISALIGIIYGVLVGFMALYLINNQDHATSAVQREANAAANIYRESRVLPQPVQSNIQADVKNYINIVVQQEWPLMQLFKKINVRIGDLVINKMFDDLKSFAPTTPAATMALQNAVTDINALYDARHDRITMSAIQLSPELWEVIIVGTILIIAINYAFRVNFYLHLFGIVAFSIMAGSMLFLLVSLDRPFQGEFSVTSDPLQEVLDIQT